MLFRSGDPHAAVAPTKYTMVPYEDVLRSEDAAKANAGVPSSSPSELHIPKSDWSLADQNSAITDVTQDIFGERDQVCANAVQRAGLRSSWCCLAIVALHDKSTPNDHASSGSASSADPDEHAHGCCHAGISPDNVLTAPVGRD